MKTKVCSKCKKKKLQKDFSLNKSERDGFYSYCKLCTKAYREANKEKLEAQKRDYNQANKDKISAYQKAYREANKEKIAAQKKAYNQANKEKIAARNKAYNQANKEKLLNYHKDYRKANKDKISAYQKAYREANKEKLAAQKKAYNQANKDKISAYREANKEKRNAYFCSYRKKRANKDLVFHLSGICRSRINHAFKTKGFKAKGFKKKSKTADMLGCDWDFLKSHIESQFKNGMSWENREKWHIDHIIPLASATSEDDVIKLSHFSNLQPLWAEENLKKADKIIECQPELTLKH